MGGLIKLLSEYIDDIRHRNEPIIKYNDDGERKVIYRLPPTTSPKKDSVLYFSAPKSGTVMMSKIMARLAYEARLENIYIVGTLFNLGILAEQTPSSTSKIFRTKGYCYGIPGMPKNFRIPIIGKVKTIILLRDPRDMMVSLYYSVKSSHPEPGQAEDAVKSKTSEMPSRSWMQSVGIDEFVTEETVRTIYGDMLKSYHKMAMQKGVRVFRYEDIVYDKARWVRDICDHFGWNVSTEIQNEIVQSVDHFPSEEQEQDHIRQVHPGNYKSKLKLEAIRSIERACKEEMDFFGYEPYLEDSEIR